MTAVEEVEALLAMPLFADVDEDLLAGLRTEAEITDGSYEWPDGATRRDGFVRFRELHDGEVVLAQGELVTEFVILLHGRVVATQARAGNDPYQHRDYGPGDWFGEVTTLDNGPALATYRTDGDSLVAAIDARMFRRLYDDDETFRQRIDDGFRDSLALHLRLSPLCKDLDDETLRGIERDAELLNVEGAEDIIEAGTPADCVYLVRSGGVESYVESHGATRTLGYYKGNATFGEHTLLSEAPTWPASFRTLMQSTLVKLPKATLDRLSDDGRRGLVRAANRLVGPEDASAARNGDASDVGSRGVLEELFVMVERESAKGGRALVIDRHKCVRCNMCVESCEAVHDDGVPRLSKVGTPVADRDVLVTACYHCETPECMLSCGYAAIRRDPQGRVRFEYDLCVGCAACIDGCPYGVIRYVEPKPPPPPRPSFWQTLPMVGKWFGGDAAAATGPAAQAGDGDGDGKQRAVGAGGDVNPVNGKTLKCDLCAGLPFEACVYNCPTTAIVRREPQSLFERRRL